METTNSTTTHSNYCGSRLPCGICRLTMTSCPLWNGCLFTNTPNIITTTTGTTTTGTTTVNASDVKGGKTVGHLTNWWDWLKEDMPDEQTD